MITDTPGVPHQERVRPAWVVELGKALWATVAVLLVFEFLNRTWLGLGVPGDGTWTEWHRDSASVAAWALTYVGVGIEAGRINRTWLRRLVRIFWFVLLPLCVAFLILLALGMANAY